ncbi:hypothetical protein AGMMS50284_6490 [Clostridia bacterium]|nr:hypothetical protein AGMMS50284_6490 [Clostridia bacterium]
MNKIKMTEMQKAYYIGRGESSNGITGTHLYMEIMYKGEPSDLETAFNKVVFSQPFLRTRINNEMEFVIVDELKYAILTTTGNPNDEKKITEIRNRLSHKVYTQNDFPLFSLELLGKDGHFRLFLSIDMLIADGLSLYEICREIKFFLANPEEVPFDRLDDLMYMSKYYQDQRLSERYFKSRDYYLKNLENILPPPALGYVESQADGKFNHIEQTLESSDFLALCAKAEELDLSATDVLLTAYAIVLSKWSRFSGMSINMTSFVRPRDVKYMSVIGDFTTSMLIQSKIDWNKSFLENAKNIKKSMFVAYKHSLFEVPELVRELTKIHPGITMPIVFTSMLFDGTDLWEEKFQHDYWISQTSQVNLDSQVKRLGNKLNITWDYRKNMFAPETINKMFSDYISIIKSFISEDVDVMRQFREYLLQETCSLYAKYNHNGSSPYNTTSKSLKEMFEKTVQKHANNSFITIDGSSYSFAWVYEQSKSLSERIIAFLSNNGKNKTRVAFTGRKDVQSFINIVATVLSGNSFCVINEDYGDDKKKDTLLQLDNYLLIDDNGFMASTSNTLISADESYILFTSGTTGKPKGIIITEKAALNTVFAINDMFSVVNIDKILNISNLYFDLSIYDIFASMIVGAEIISINPMYWNQLDIDIANKITIWNSTPALAKEYASKSKLNNIRLFLLSGDFVSVSLVDSLYALYSDKVKVISLGGATEASIWSNYFDCSESHNISAIPYGYPLPFQLLFVINPDSGLLCLENVLGEICISGEGLAVGYLDNEQTLQAFVWNSHLDKRIYRTGDLGYLSNDGKIYIVGRIAQEIKHNGYRIDLREIENYINSVHSVTNSLVIIERQNEMRTKLSAVVESNNRNVDTEIREYLSSTLPYYMIPSNILVVKKFPLTANGKIDSAEISRWLTAADDVLEEFSGEQNALLDVWKQTISEDVFIEVRHQDSTYFDAGGQSLQAVELRNTIEKEFKVNVSLQDVMSNISLRAMANLIEAKKKESFSTDIYNRSNVNRVGEIILLRKGTANKNLVLIHAGSGEINIYLGLAKYFDEEYNVFAIKRNHNMSRVAPGEFDFAWFAKQYEEALSSFTNVDILGGWCIGGSIAYEMSLINPNKFKNLLFFNAESPIPNPPSIPDFTVADEIRMLSEYGNLPVKAEDFPNVETLWQMIVKVFEANEPLRLQFVQSLPQELTRLLPPLEHQTALVTVYYVNHWRSAFVARDHYKGSDRSQSHLLYLNAYEDPMDNFANWDNFVTGFEYFDIQGNHASLFAEENVSVWSIEMNKRLKSWVEV